MEDKNILKKLGMPWTDKEFIEEFNLDARLEGSVGINAAMYDHVENSTVQGLLKEGVDEKTATKRGREVRMNAEKNHMKQLAARNENAK